MSRILEKHAPLKKLRKHKLLFKTKPWNTMTLQKSFSIKNKLFSDFNNEKTLFRKLNFTLNKKSNETCYLP